MSQHINIEGLKPEQIKDIQAMVDAFKIKNQTNKNETEIDMIEYLLENPLYIDDLEFIKREDIYDSK